MDLRFYPLHFEFLAEQTIRFPPGQASNILRGALGTIFRSFACTPQCRENDHTRTCAYAKIFEPVSGGIGPSGLADSPRPFVFRARHLNGVTVAPGQFFNFGLNLFCLEAEIRDYFIQTFAAVAHEGLGPGRAKAKLVQADVVEPVILNLEPPRTLIDLVRVDFLSPIELKHAGGIAERPEFPILFSRIRDRVSTLRALYGAGTIEMDFQASGDRAAQIRMIGCEMTREESTRRSSRTGQVHSIGGLTGYAEYEGDLTEFLPWLEAARFTGVGRQAVWGKGEISVRTPDASRVSLR